VWLASNNNNNNIRSRLPETLQKLLLVLHVFLVLLVLDQLIGRKINKTILVCRVSHWSAVGVKRQVRDYPPLSTIICRQAPCEKQPINEVTFRLFGTEFVPIPSSKSYPNHAIWGLGEADSPACRHLGSLLAAILRPCAGSFF